MKILITGAFGNLGTQILNLLKNTEHEVRCFSTKSRRAKKVARKYKQRFEIFYGDIRNFDDVVKAVKDQDIVIHLAAIVPPKFNHISLDYSREVNVCGTDNVVQAIKQSEQKTKIIFASSVAVFGDVRRRGACVLASDEPPNPNADDIYAQQKVLAEEIILKAPIQWSIFRFGFMLNIDNLKMDPMMFEVPLDTNMEIIHLRDAAYAVVQALEKEEIWQKIMLVAGGEDCRLTYKEFVSTMLNTMGVGELPEEAFTKNDFHCAFMDTTESQELLKYQRSSFDDTILEMKQKTKVLRFFAILFRPIAKSFILSQSRYYQHWKRSRRRRKSI